jgi:DNA-binding LytR/AlgR family response regulator
MNWKPFFVYQDKALVKIKSEDIISLLAEDNYTKIFLPGNSFYLVRSTLSSALKNLPSELFIKIHRSIAVSILYIETINRDHLIVCNKPVPIAKQYYKSVLKQLTIIK